MTDLKPDEVIIPDEDLVACERQPCSEAVTLIIEGEKVCITHGRNMSLFARSLDVSYGGAVADRMRATQANANARLRGAVI